MREILFRGKPIVPGKYNGGSFAIGYYCCSPSGKHYIELSTASGCKNPVEVNPDTVGQYTGLTDKNGKKIFEGDIVDLFGMKGKVVQECGAFGIAFMKTIDYDLLESKIPFNNNANFCFNDNFISFWEVFWNYEQDDNPLYEVEAIGNVHDNPKLLEGTNGN